MGPRLTHLFICREYPPAAYPPGGIGTYVRHMTTLLAAAGHTVHVIAHRWEGAPAAREELVGGRLIVHRVALDEHTLSATPGDADVPAGLLMSSCPSQAFSWQAAAIAERLVESEGIDVIEAQEWEAPLYYFQVRRALGLGPARRPPCVVHLHSPTELIFAANRWDTNVADYRPATSLETYSIAAADAILCPSRYLAEQAVSRYQIDRSRLHVIPYPLGDFPHIDRSSSVWESGSVSYVGRLEPRKGVLEWMEAASGAAAERASLVFEFVGGDTPLQSTGSLTVGQSARTTIPRRLRRQFRFHGSRDRAGVEGVLARSWMSAVPSRWENFPFSCIESMCSGLPVVVSPEGGMRELVEDGVSGWVAPDATPVGLAQALNRALRTSGADRARMGAAAEDRVRRVCANDQVVDRHIEVKARLAHASAARVPRAAAHAADLRPRKLGVVVTATARTSALEACLASLRAQTDAPASVCVVADQHVPELPAGWRMSTRNGRHAGAAALAAALEMIADPALGSVVFVDGRVSLDPSALARCRVAFDEDPTLGVVSPWTRQTSPRDLVRVQPLPAMPHLWQEGQLHPVVSVRRAVLHRAICAECEPSDPPSTIDPRIAFLDRAIESGWTARAYPAVLGSLDTDIAASASGRRQVRYSSMAQAIQRLHMPLLQWLRTSPPADRIAFVRQNMRHPARSAKSLTGRALFGWRSRQKGSM